MRIVPRKIRDLLLQAIPDSPMNAQRDNLKRPEDESHLAFWQQLPSSDEIERVIHHRFFGNHFELVITTMVLPVFSMDDVGDFEPSRRRRGGGLGGTASHHVMAEICQAYLEL